MGFLLRKESTITIALLVCNTSAPIIPPLIIAKQNTDKSEHYRIKELIDYSNRCRSFDDHLISICNNRFDILDDVFQAVSFKQ